MALVKGLKGVEAAGKTQSFSVLKHKPKVWVDYFFSMILTKLLNISVHIVHLTYFALNQKFKQNLMLAGIMGWLKGTFLSQKGRSNTGSETKWCSVNIACTQSRADQDSLVSSNPLQFTTHLTPYNSTSRKNTRYLSLI